MMKWDTPRCVGIIHRTSAGPHLVGIIADFTLVSGSDVGLARLGVSELIQRNAVRRALSLLLLLEQTV